ncbi:MAG: GIY-YIG nuclease family protein [Bacilli bacterium]
MAYIYKISNDINDKIYIGKTLNTIQERFKEHCRDYLKREEEKRPLYSAMKKYGIEHFQIQEIEQCYDEDASNREIYWISYYDSYKKGYNATLGGEGKQKYNHQEILNLLRQGMSTNEIISKIGCCKDIIYDIAKNNNINLAMISQKDTAKKLSKKVAQYDKDMNYKQTFNSVADAARWLYEQKIIPTLSSGVRTHIAEVCNGKRKTAYQSIWKYI